MAQLVARATAGGARLAGHRASERRSTYCPTRSASGRVSHAIVSISSCPARTAGSADARSLRALQSGPVGGGLLVRVVAGRQGQAAVNYYLRTYRTITALPITPTSLVNFGEAVNFPLIFGGMLALSGPRRSSICWW